MKKLTIFLFICTSLNVFAQKKSFFGVNAGINIANQRVHQEYYFQSGVFVSTGPPNGSFISTSFFQNVIRPTASLFYQYGFNEKMGLRLNVQYMGLGYRNNGATPDKLNINYFTLPLTFHYSVNKHLSFNVGPYLSFTLGGTKMYGEAITKTYHRNDNGFVFGGEHDIYKNFAVSANYIWGLKNIWLSDTDNYYHIHTKYTNRALQITLLYKFNFKKSS